MGDAVLAFFHRDDAAEACRAARWRGPLRSRERPDPFRSDSP
jgi:hypothetical protein